MITTHGAGKKSSSRICSAVNGHSARERFRGKARLDAGLFDRTSVNLRRRYGLAHARRLPEERLKFPSLSDNGHLPAFGPLLWLELPLHKVFDDYDEAAAQLAVLARPHVLDLFRQMLDIDFSKTPLPQQPGGFSRPASEVLLVEQRSRLG